MPPLGDNHNQSGFLNCSAISFQFVVNAIKHLGS